MTATQTMPRPRTQPDVHRLPRRIPGPATEPPYDDERGFDTDGQLTDGALALDISASTMVAEPAVEELSVARHLRVVQGPGSKRPSEDPFFAPQPTPRGALPDPKSWCGRFVQALIEVLTGDRPSAQLLRWTNERVYADVVARVRALGGAPVTVRGGRGRVLVRSVHICEPRDGVAEAAIHVKHGGRSRAVAVRVEGLDGRWRCTALRLG
ncbi:Rv3235 family protein [Actinopolymorpha sp. B17G11]|uniref:Rv3235 family protein n=1 Tax=unclassified Actinopolymorpha TaxID=2627063 RepID=UPI0032D94669